MNAHTLPPSRSPQYIDLTASLPGLRSSLTPQAAEFSAVTSSLRLPEADRVASSMFGLGIGAVAGMIGLILFSLLTYEPQHTTTTL